MYTKGDIFYDIHSNVWGQILDSDGVVLDSLCLPGSDTKRHTEKEAFKDMTDRLNMLLSHLNRNQT